MNESGNITEAIANLALQLGILLFAVRVCGKLVKKIGIPQVLGELLAGVAIGPYALGGIKLASIGFPNGIFPLPAGGSLAVSTELYAIAQIASVILLFASGLETDIGLFLRYSLAGGLIGIGGVAVSFILGDMAGVLFLPRFLPEFGPVSFTHPACLFMGILSTATSVGITARILSDQKKMDSPEGVTILAAAVFDDVLGIIALAIVLGIVALLTKAGGEGVHAAAILAIAGKAFGIWLGFTALGLLLAKKIAAFLKLFKSPSDFSVLALGLALLLAGGFERSGLAMIIGAYIAGLSLSKTDIAAVIQERIEGLYEFFVPVFFAVMGMQVNVPAICSRNVLIFGAIYTGIAILAKVLGCGGPALLLGFNGKGALRIGCGMIPRGEVALIIAGIGLTAGILDEAVFGVIILMTLVTTLAAPPFLSLSLKIKGAGTRKPVSGNDTITEYWDFSSPELAGFVSSGALAELRGEGFFVQTMNPGEGLTQARKGDVALSIVEEGNRLSIEAAKSDIPFVRNLVYEVIVELRDTVEQLRSSLDPKAMRLGLMDTEGRASKGLLQAITPENVILNLKGHTKKAIITELVDLLAANGRLLNRDEALADVLEREKTMSTGMEYGIALPHGKTDGVEEMEVAVGVRKEGVNFDSADGEKSRLFILIVSPRKAQGPHVQFLAAIGAVLRDEQVREQVINAATPEDLAALLQKGVK
ncbi:MAG: cation:proton antiporter [Treponema sp.]|jgi:Kef-type K+ transport system membrane component KefB/mannitol/fructose-specific phosphotransferase system IIA component (Ntr-type)|nr:cation:proton antiporter [Treponema sp.]